MERHILAARGQAQHIPASTGHAHAESRHPLHAKTHAARPLAHGRRIVGAPAQGAHIHFNTTEMVSILISIITLVLAFNIFKISDSGIILGVVLGIVLHEIAHKVVAQSMGFESRYKLWEIGLVLVIAFAIITRGRFIFAAPGFVVTEGEASTRHRGLISLSAPAANIALAALFFAMGPGVAWARSAAYVNALLAVFNLLPLPPLDGARVIEWNQGAWGAAFVMALGLCVVLFV